MNLKINGLNFDITDAIRSHVEGKLERIGRHADNLLKVTVTLSVDKLDNKAEAHVHVAGKELHVEQTDKTDMYAAIDVLMDKLDRAVLKHKEKSNDVRAAGAASETIGG